MTPHDVLVFNRFLLDTGLATVWGGGGLVLLVEGRVKQSLIMSMRLPLAVAGLLSAAAAATALPVQTAAIASNWSALERLDLMAIVALHTNVGISLVLQAMTSVGLFIAVFKKLHQVGVGLAGLAICELASRGHPAGSSDGAAFLRMGVDAIHALSATAWVGALFPFVLLLRLSQVQDLRRDVITSMKRFSRLGHIAVAVVLASGIANTFFILGRLPLNLEEDYQRKLLIKIGVAVAMTFIAIANRYLILPFNRTHPTASRRALTAGAALEVALGLLAFALVSSFGLDDPTT
ncbi:CopD family protein [Oryzifoliimicrobium ureilyticus]|uniref:CopD family protein n=1 Tax=Oryzifoliimicrobium ureilyticus TaxID=3113724 RepID=UPI00307654CE